MQKEFYKAMELAELLDLNVMTIYRWIKSGKLKAYRIGKSYHIPKEEFNKTLQRARAK